MRSLRSLGGDTPGLSPPPGAKRRWGRWPEGPEGAVLFRWSTRGPDDLDPVSDGSQCGVRFQCHVSVGESQDDETHVGQVVGAVALVAVLMRRVVDLNYEPRCQGGKIDYPGANGYLSPKPGAERSSLHSSPETAFRLSHECSVRSGPSRGQVGVAGPTHLMHPAIVL